MDRLQNRLASVVLATVLALSSILASPVMVQEGLAQSGGGSGSGNATFTDQPSDPGGSLEVRNATTPEQTGWAAFVLNGEPFLNEVPKPCTTAGPTFVGENFAYRIVQFQDLSTSKDTQNRPYQPFTKIVFEAPRLKGGKEYIQWIAKDSQSYFSSSGNPVPEFRNVTYIPGGQYFNLQGNKVTRGDRLEFTGGSMPAGGRFKIAFAFFGGAKDGDIFDVQVKGFYADGFNGVRTDGVAFGTTLYDPKNDTVTTHAQKDDTVALGCGAGRPSRDLEIRVEKQAPTLTDAVAYDVDHNGHLDHIVLQFNESLDVYKFNPQAFDITTKLKSGLRHYTPINPVIWESNRVFGEQRHDRVNLTVAEVADYDTGAQVPTDTPMPTVNLLGDAGPAFQDIAGNVGKLKKFAVRDGAPPVLVSAYAYEGARQLVLRFSEGVYGSAQTPDVTSPALACNNHSASSSSPDYYPPLAILKCNFEYFDGAPGLNQAPSTAADNCIRSYSLSEFDDPDPKVSPPGFATVILPLNEAPGSVGARTGFCAKDVDITTNWHDWIRARGANLANAVQNAPGKKDLFNIDTSPSAALAACPSPPPTPAPNCSDLRSYGGVLYDISGNALWSQPACPPNGSGGSCTREAGECTLPEDGPQDIFVVSGREVHDGTGGIALGPNVMPGPCFNIDGHTTPVAPPHVTWVEVDNDHAFARMHFSGPVANLTFPPGNLGCQKVAQAGKATDCPLVIDSVDVVTVAGGGAGGVTSVVHLPDSDSILLNLDHVLNPKDVSDTPSKVRIRCDPNYDGPWSWIVGTALPNDGTGDNRHLKAHGSAAVLPDGRSVPPSVTVPCGDYPMLDRTPPHIVYANTTDRDADGFVDGLALTFSEPVDDASYCGTFGATCPAEVFTGLVSLNAMANVSDATGRVAPKPNTDVEVWRNVDPQTNFTYDTGSRVNDRNAFLRFRQDFAPNRHNHIYTNALFDLTTMPRAQLINDLSDPLHGANHMLPIGMFDVTERDGAPPHPVLAETVDTPLKQGKFNQYAEGNGYIDAYRVTFSEKVEDASFAPCEWRVSGTEENGTAHVYDVTGYETAYPLDRDAGHPAGLVNDNVLYVLFKPNSADPNGDTDQKPQLTYVQGGGGACQGTSPNGLLDRIDDRVAAISQFPEAAPGVVPPVVPNRMDTFHEGDVLETDRAAPVIVALLAQVGDQNVTVVFSEPVDNGHGKPLVWRDFLYGNNDGSGAAGQPSDFGVGDQYHKAPDAIQNTYPFILDALRTNAKLDPDTDSIPATQYVLLPLNAPLSPQDMASQSDIAGNATSTADYLGMHLNTAREVAPSVPPAERQYSATVPHIMGLSPDTTPPAGIFDLSVNGETPSGPGALCGTSNLAGLITPNSVTLQWHAPGDDDNRGTVAGYDVRVSTRDISAASFDNTDMLSLGNLLPQWDPGTPSGPDTPLNETQYLVTPAAAGQVQTLQIAGLAPLSTYYFAVRPVDDGHLEGPVSNSCQATTLQDLTAPPYDLTPCPPADTNPALCVSSPDHAAGSTSGSSAATFAWNPVGDPEGGTIIYRYALSENPDYQVLSTDTQTTGLGFSPDACPGVVTPTPCAYYPPGSIANGTWTFSVAAFSGGGAGKTAHYTFTVGTTPLSDSQLRKANELLQNRTSVVRRSGLNTVTWTLPDAKDLPGTVQFVQVWRKDTASAALNNVPVYGIVATLCSGVPQEYSDCPGTYASLRNGNWTDPTPTATDQSEYRVDMVFAGSNGPQTQKQTTTGFKSLQNGGGNPVPSWVWLLLGGALALIVAGIVLALVLRSRNKKAVRAEAVPYAWTATGDVVLDPVTGLPIHDVKCPNCGVDFQAQGELPLQITCPSCGIGGVLN